MDCGEEVTEGRSERANERDDDGLRSGRRKCSSGVCEAFGSCVRLHTGPEAADSRIAWVQEHRRRAF